MNDSLKSGGKPVIGLLGGPGSGKSTVARAFAAHGCGVIDADALSREALVTDGTRHAVRQWWGDAVLDAEGRPDRSAIARLVFADPEQLRRLEALIHPMVHAERGALRASMQADSRLVAIIEDCPLLLESGLEGECDALVFVATPREQQLARVRASRGWDEVELDRRQARQIALDTKRSRADYVVDNGDGADLNVQTRRILQAILHAQP